MTGAKAAPASTLEPAAFEAEDGSVAAGTKSEILVVASNPVRRDELATLLATEARVRAVDPSGLQDEALLLDAPVAAVVLDGSDPEELERLLPIRELPAGRAMVLLAEKVCDDALEEAIHRLEPLQVLSSPVQAPSLRLAIRRALPSPTPKPTTVFPFSNRRAEETNGAKMSG